MAACIVAPARAAIGVAPLSATIESGETTAAFTIKNPENVDRVVEPQVSRWEHVDGKDVLTKTSDWIVNPPLVSIPPLGYRIIRIALKRRVPTLQESTYRIVLSEIATHERNGMGVVVNAHVSLPIFVEGPSRAKPASQWSAVSDGSRQIVVRLKNDGPRHAHIMKFSLRNPSGKAFEVEAPSYVFAGETRDWTLVLPTPGLDVRSVLVEAFTDAGTDTMPVRPR